MRPDSWFKNPTDGGVTRCVFKDNKILSPWSQFFWSMWRIKNAEVEHGLQIKYEKYRILWLKIITLLVLRCFLQAFWINLTASICQEKSIIYILISNYILMIIVNPFPWQGYGVESKQIMPFRKNLILLDQTTIEIAEKVLKIMKLAVKPYTDYLPRNDQPWRRATSLHRTPSHEPPLSYNSHPLTMTQQLKRLPTATRLLLRQGPI